MYLKKFLAIAVILSLVLVLIVSPYGCRSQPEPLPAPEPTPTGLQIIVQDMNDDAIYNAEVVSSSQPVAQDELSGSADETGMVFFEDIEPGEYLFLVSHPDYHSKYIKVSLLPEFIVLVTVSLEQ